MKIVIVLLAVLLNLFAKDNHPKDLIVDISNLKKGELLIDVWSGQPILIYKRTDKDINFLNNFDKNKYLPQNMNLLKSSMQYAQRITNINYYMIDQPNLEKSKFRSKRKDIFVAIGSNAMNGIFIQQVKKDDITFFTANKHLYDNSGKNYKPSKQYSSYNLFIPPHYYIDEKLIIGVQTRLNEYKEYNFDNTNYKRLPLDKRLWVATQFCNLNEVKKSIKEGANPNKRFSSDTTAIFGVVAMKCNKKISIINELLKADAKINLCNKNKFSPLDNATHTDLETIKYLVKNGAIIKDICNKSEEEIEVFKFNLKNKPDIEEYFIKNNYFSK